MTAQLPGVFVTHEPIGSPGHNVGLALRDGHITAWASIWFDGPPGRHLAHVPGSVKGLFVRIIRVKELACEIAGCGGRTSSSAFGMLIALLPILPSHAPIVTYSPGDRAGPRNTNQRLD